MIIVHFHRNSIHENMKCIEDNGIQNFCFDIFVILGNVVVYGHSYKIHCIFVNF